MSEIDKVEKIVQDVQEARSRLTALTALLYRLNDGYHRQVFHWYDGLLRRKSPHSNVESAAVITKEEASLFQKWIKESEQPRLEALIKQLEARVAVRDTSDEDDSAFVNTPNVI